MTMWHDQPPQTRRQARESERSAVQPVSRRAATVEPTPAGEIPAVTMPFVLASARRTSDDVDQADAESSMRRSLQASESFSARPRGGRYAGTSFDSLLKQEQTKAAVYRSARPVGVAEPLTTTVTVVPSAAPARPPRRASAPAGAPTPTGPVPVQGAVPVQVSQPTPATEQQSGSAPEREPAPERTLTRRELRALLQAEEAERRAALGLPPETIEDEPRADPQPERAPGPRRNSRRATRAAEAASATAEVAPAITASAFSPVIPGASFGPGATVATDRIDATPHPFSPPVGHWSLAAGDQQLSSSGSSTTSNALILPMIPSAGATVPLGGTGEVLLTGTIELPHGFGSTGQHPSRFDTSAMDRLFEQEVDSHDTGNVAPVRASRAVSTHTPTRGVVTPPKARSTRLPAVLVVTASVLFVGVVGLIVAGFVMNVF